MQAPENNVFEETFEPKKGEMSSMVYYITRNLVINVG
jgi:hypothetical protein